MYKHCVDKVIRICVLEKEMESILNHCHGLACGGHFRGFNWDSIGIACSRMLTSLCLMFAFFYID